MNDILLEKLVLLHVLYWYQTTHAHDHETIDHYIIHVRVWYEYITFYLFYYVESWYNFTTLYYVAVD